MLKRMLKNYRNPTYTLSPKNQNFKIHYTKNCLSIPCQYLISFECVQNYEEIMNYGKPKETKSLDNRIELNSC